MAVQCKVFGHQWRIKQRSNVIQFDDMGYPLRLFICECKYCMKSEQMWIDSTECKNDVVLQWSDDDYIPIPPSKGSYLTKDQQSVFRNAINVALAVIDKHIRESREIMGCIADIVYGDVECNCNCGNCHWWDEPQESEE